MRTRAILCGLLAGIVIGLGVTAPASGGQYTRKCGDHLDNGAGWWNLKTIETACRVARTFADSYVFEGVGAREPTLEWRCREKQIGDEVWRVTCNREKKGRSQRIRFLYGA